VIDFPNRRRIADHSHHRAFEAGVVDRAAEHRQRVHPADLRIDQVGLVPLPAGLVFLGSAVVVDREQHPPPLPGGGPEVDG